jgi:hypothetical protein
VTSREPAKRRVSVDLSEETLSWLDSLKPELGLRGRGAILEAVLAWVRPHSSSDEDDEDLEDEQGALPLESEAVAGADQTGTQHQSMPTGALDETTAIVLISSALVSSRDQERVPDGTEETNLQLGLGRGSHRAEKTRPRASSGSAGIQLPGFVRRQARELRRSLEAEVELPPDRSLALISSDQLSEAQLRAEQHWHEVYGQAPSEPALEAAMVWLARDVWPQSDHSDGRPFTWSLTQQVVRTFAPSWIEAEATLERVITAAGVLEDPFSGSTLPLRIPTLITRFVQRHRSRQKRTTSFEAIDQSMTVHAALRLLLLPTVADRPYTLPEIREAYREQAQCHHPDAGGSAEAMRRLNEAYQFLKERYRTAG